MPVKDKTTKAIHANQPPPIVYEAEEFHYLVGSKLGKGGFALCYRAEVVQNNRKTGRMVALKVVKAKLENRIAQRFTAELQLHSKLRHPNIVDFYRAFTFDDSTYVVLELCENGSLADMLKKRGFLSMPEIRRIVIQICGAVKYLHLRHVIHRDLKTANLFLDKNMNVKVGDFGLAALLVSKDDINGARRNTLCGTPNYLAPEFLEKGGKGHNEKVDIWAIGVIAYTLAVGKVPFCGSKREEVYQRLQSCDYTWPEPSATTNKISFDLKDLVGRLLVHEDDRPCPDKIVSHRFFRLSYVPDKLDTNCLTECPSFPNSLPSSPEVIKRGYTESWYTLCKSLGVGEWPEGKAFSLIGGHRFRSIVRDCDREIELGRNLIIPFPQGQVYRPYPDRPTIFQTGFESLSGITEEKETFTSVNTSNSTSASGSTASSINTSNSNSSNITGRTTAVSEKSLSSGKSVTSTIRGSKTEWKLNGKLKENISPEDKLSVNIIKTKPAETVFARKSARRNQEATRKRVLSEFNSEHERCVRYTDKPVNRSINRQADVKLDHEVRNSPRKCGGSQRSKKPTLNPGPRPNRQECGKISSTSQDVNHELPVYVPFNGEHDKVPPKKMKSRIDKGPTSGRIKDPAPVTTLKLPDNTLSSKPDSSNDISSSSFVCELIKLPHTDPSSVKARLTVLLTNIRRALDDKGCAGQTNTSSSSEPRIKLPYVTKWVDYAKRDGVGYVLEDGTVGVIEKSSSIKPVRFVVVRNGFHYLQLIRQNRFEIASIPAEFYTDSGKDGLHSLASSARATDIASLATWERFGRFMFFRISLSDKSSDPISEARVNCPLTLANPCLKGAIHPSGKAVLDTCSNIPPVKFRHFVRFYQRLGNVGVWGFENGAFQFNFPDHTKLVLSWDGRLCLFVCLSQSSIKHLKQTHRLTPELMNERKSIFSTVANLLAFRSTLRTVDPAAAVPTSGEIGVTSSSSHKSHRSASQASRRLDGRLAEINGFRVKLSFIANVVEQWLTTGGLGHLSPASRYLRWSGLSLDDQRRWIWTTVGALSGDQDSYSLQDSPS